MHEGAPPLSGLSELDPIRNRLNEIAVSVGERVLGQGPLIERLLLGLCAGGHVLMEGLPGLAKTTIVRLLGQALGFPFGRVQMTPDILPGDVLGSEFLKPDLSGFVFRPGPIFTTILLVDELNRAPAKVQSALLEAMQERQVTVGGQTHRLPKAFWLVATQNPIDQEGTYPLAESQKDRFLMRLTVDYPDPAAEVDLLRIAEEPLEAPMPASDIDTEAIMAVRDAMSSVHCADVLVEWAHRVVLATRDPKRVGLNDEVLWGVSPRGARMWLRAARTRAWWSGRDYVVPEDLRALADDVLSHRIVEDWSGHGASESSSRRKLLTERIMERIGPP